MRIGHRVLRAHLTVGLEDHEALLASLAVGRHSEVSKRLVDALVPDPDLHHRARLLRSRHLAAELLGESHCRLNLLHGRDALPLAVP
jgi:hypothetical protein